jgi:hypothetical protein
VEKYLYSDITKDSLVEGAKAATATIKDNDYCWNGSTVKILSKTEKKWYK